ncbi:MAG: hypothetical protein LBK41_01920 [Clostridiales bacterium]|jgi:hypothetical protein|nr:hypothetical protein [Clostridiales bacterium]
MESYSEVSEWDNNITRLFVWHNFSDGVMWVVYSQRGYDSSGVLAAGSRNVMSKWTIRKENGEWEIVKIEEAP